MNKKFYGTLLLGTLLLGSTIVSCKDYDDDIDNLQNQITQLATKADMQSEVSKLQSAVATAQAAAENKAAVAEQAAKDAAAKAQAAADAAAKAQGSADAAATVEALNQVAAEAAAAAQAADEAKAAAEAKAEELASQLAELQALAATLVSTEDFEAAKKELNDKYAELAAKIGETTGVTGMTGINLVGWTSVEAGYGNWKGVHNNMKSAEWDGPKAKEINAIEKGTKLAAWGVKDITFSVNPTDFDASKIEAFAIVNQFDEVAPIAFGTPKAVTRAAAGAWTLPILGNTIYGEKAAEFEAKFKNANNQNGTTATLVAGQFAGELRSGYCTVSENINSDYSTGFKATVAYDAVDGVIELKANDATKVLDAYITTINKGLSGDAAKNAHDSVVYKLAYTGTTLTYDAAAVKKLLDDNAGKAQTIVLNMKEINLNGYIHTSTGTVTFEAKNKPETIKAERVELDKVSHDITPIVWNSSTGKNVNNQSLTVSILPALKEWGIDLSKTTDEATIHWNHTIFTTTSFALGAESYYLNKDQVPVEIKNLATAKLVRDADKKIANIELYFSEDYSYETKEYDSTIDVNSDDKVDNMEDGIDAAFNGKLIYIPVVFTGTDSDNGVDKEVEYSVVIPVQFNKIKVENYYKWNKGNDVRIPIVSGTGPNSSTILASTPASCSFDNIYKSKNNVGALVSLAKPTFQGKKADGTNTAITSEVAYVVPSVTVSGQMGAAYKMAIEDRRKEGYLPSGTPTPEVIENSIKYAYMNAVTVTLGTSPTTIEPKWLKVAANTYNWALEGTTAGTASTSIPAAGTYSEDVTLNITQPSLTTAETASTSTYNGKKYMNLLQNAKYTISGIAGTIMGRKVSLGDLEVEVYTAATSAYTVELSDNKIFNDTSAPTMYFANKAYAPVGADAAKFSKTFSVANKYGAFEIPSTGVITPKYVQYVFADGSVTPITPGIYNRRITVKSEAYNIDEKTTPTTKNGLSFKVATIPPSLADEDSKTHLPAEIVKIRVTLPMAQFKMVSDNSVVAAEDITFEFEVSK